MDILFHKISGTVLNWSVLCKEDKKEVLLEMAGELKSMAKKVFWLTL
jgi:hypothetical protein